MSGRQLKGEPWDTVCLWHSQLVVAQSLLILSLTAVQLREKGGDCKWKMGGQLYMWHLIKSVWKIKDFPHCQDMFGVHQTFPQRFSCWKGICWKLERSCLACRWLSVQSRLSEVLSPNRQMPLWNPGVTLAIVIICRLLLCNLLLTVLFSSWPKKVFSNYAFEKLMRAIRNCSWAP